MPEGCDRVGERHQKEQEGTGLAQGKRNKPVTPRSPRIFKTLIRFGTGVTGSFLLIVGGMKNSRGESLFGGIFPIYGRGEKNACVTCDRTFKEEIKWKNRRNGEEGDHL